MKFGLKFINYLDVYRLQTWVNEYSLFKLLNRLVLGKFSILQVSFKRIVFYHLFLWWIKRIPLKSILEDKDMKWKMGLVPAYLWKVKILLGFSYNVFWNWGLFLRVLKISHSSCHLLSAYSLCYYPLLSQKPQNS